LLLTAGRYRDVAALSLSAHRILTREGPKSARGIALHSNESNHWDISHEHRHWRLARRTAFLQESGVVTHSDCSGAPHD
jgi:hypothetical protein